MGYEIQRITSGTTLTAQSSLKDIIVLYDPASLAASLTETLPKTPFDGQVCSFSFGGTIAGNTAVVTSLTISANTGQTLVQKSAPAAAVGGDLFSYVYVAVLSKWFRLN